MSVITDGDQYEKIIVFGGISNKPGPKKDITDVQSFLSNQTYIISVQQKNSQSMKFKGKKEGDSSRVDMREIKANSEFVPSPAAGENARLALNFSQAAEGQ